MTCIHTAHEVNVVQNQRLGFGSKVPRMSRMQNKTDTKKAQIAPTLDHTKRANGGEGSVFHQLRFLLAVRILCASPQKQVRILKFWRADVFVFSVLCLYFFFFFIVKSNIVPVQCGTLFQHRNFSNYIPLMQCVLLSSTVYVFLFLTAGKTKKKS